MAEKIKKGLPSVMRYCDTLADYEQNKADGKVTDDVLVIVLEEQLIIFKGKIGHWPKELKDSIIDTELSDTSENSVQNKVIKNALDNLTKEVVDNEEVTAAALAELDNRINEIGTVLTDDIPATYATKESVENLTEEILSNEEVTAAALTDLDNRVSKKQDVLTDGENIKTINGESILGEGNIEIQGGGGGVELLEVKYNWDGTELTDEDKAVNAATYAKIAEGGDYIVYWDFHGAKVIASIIAAPTTDYPSLMLLVESEILYGLDAYPFLMEIIADGSIGYIANASAMKVISFMDGFTYDELEMWLNKYGAFESAFALMGGIVFSPPYVIGEIFYTMYDGAEVTLYVNSILGGVVLIKGDITNRTVSVTGLEGLQIDLSPYGYTLVMNKMAFGDSVNHGSFLLYKNTTHYNPLSSKAIYENSQVIAYEFVIYKDNEFQTWRLNNDGTTEQIIT